MFTFPVHNEVYMPKSEILFVLHNAGETYDLLPVIQRLAEREANYAVLTLGVATDLVKGKIDKNHTVTLSRLGIETVVDKTFPREKTLLCEEIEKITQLLPVQQVVSGNATAIQDQIINAYKKKNARTYVYWDNFNSIGNDPYFEIAQKVIRSAACALFPSKVCSEAKEFHDLKTKIVVGKPSMQEWKRSFDAIDTKEIRLKLGVNDNARIITWIGGYGSQHKKAFELFVSCVKQLPIEELPAKVIIQQHPNAKKEELDPCTYFEKDDPLLISENTHLSTQEAVAVADCVMTYNSTALIQAMLLGKNGFYVIPPHDTTSNILFEKGFANIAYDPQTFYEGFKASNQENLWELLGIPEEGKEAEEQKRDSVSLFINVLDGKDVNSNLTSLLNRVQRFNPCCR